MSAVPGRDALFHVLMGADRGVTEEACERSARRVAAYTGTDTPLRLAEQAARSATHARAVFVVLLHADPELRREVVQGTALRVATRGLCEFRAASLFAQFYRRVLDGWLRTELNSPLDLVEAFEYEYLVA